MESQLKVSLEDHVLICANCEKAIAAGKIKVHAYSFGENPRIGFFHNDVTVEIVTQNNFLPKTKDSIELEVVDICPKDIKIKTFKTRRKNE